MAIHEHVADPDTTDFHPEISGVEASDSFVPGFPWGNQGDGARPIFVVPTTSAGHIDVFRPSSPERRLWDLIKYDAAGEKVEHSVVLDELSMPTPMLARRTYTRDGAYTSAEIRDANVDIDRRNNERANKGDRLRNELADMGADFEAASTN